MNIIKRLAIGCMCAGAFSGATSAGVPAGAVVQNVPGEISYQGVLANPATGAIYADGVYTLDVRIWNHGTRKTGCVWGAKYTVPVKDGYFNLMLGDGMAANLVADDGELPQFGKDELWKALWGENAEDTVRYLGITPHEDSLGRPVSVLTEISPRHQLLASPFAFRAEKAHYVDGADGAFSVGGKLTVEGNATFNAGLSAPNTALTQNLGPIQTSGTDVRVGGAAASSNLKDVYAAGNALTFSSWGDLEMGSSAGDLTFSLLGGWGFYAQGMGALILDAWNNTIGGTGATTIRGSRILIQECDTNGNKYKNGIEYEQVGGDVAIRGGSGFAVKHRNANVVFNGVDNAWAVGKNAVNLSSGNSYIEVNKSRVGGRGPFRWQQRECLAAPILFRDVQVTVAAGNTYQDFYFRNLGFTRKDLKHYGWMAGAWWSDSWYGLAELGITTQGGDNWDSFFRIRKHHAFEKKMHKVNIRFIGYANRWF